MERFISVRLSDFPTDLCPSHVFASLSLKLQSSLPFALLLLYPDCLGLRWESQTPGQIGTGLVWWAEAITKDHRPTAETHIFIFSQSWYWEVQDPGWGGRGLSLGCRQDPGSVAGRGLSLGCRQPIFAVLSKWPFLVLYEWTGASASLFLSL